MPIVLEDENAEAATTVAKRFSQTLSEVASELKLAFKQSTPRIEATY